MNVGIMKFALPLLPVNKIASLVQEVAENWVNNQIEVIHAASTENFTLVRGLIRKHVFAHANKWRLQIENLSQQKYPGAA